MSKEIELSGDLKFKITQKNNELGILKHEKYICTFCDGFKIIRMNHLCSLMRVLYIDIGISWISKIKSSKCKSTKPSHQIGLIRRFITRKKSKSVVLTLTRKVTVKDRTIKFLKSYFTLMSSEMQLNIST